MRVTRYYTGRGPTKARTIRDADTVVVQMGDLLTKGERKLVETGKQDFVLTGRQEYQQAMRDDLVAAVEEITGRKVIAFMSANHIDPDMAVETFVLEPIADPS